MVCRKMVSLQLESKSKRWSLSFGGICRLARGLDRLTITLTQVVADKSAG
jgi:hypothetical protein